MLTSPGHDILGSLLFLRKWNSPGCVPMSDVLVVAGFLGMVIAPCVVALHASLAEEGPELGYAATYRRLRARLIDTLRI